MKAGFIKDKYELILGGLQSVLTITYLLMIGIGMIFNYKKYAFFGVNIFQYSDVFDYLIAPFEDFRILLFSVVTLLIIYFSYRFDNFTREKYPKYFSLLNFGFDKKSWFKLYRLCSYFIIFLIYLHSFATIYGRATKARIEKQADILITYADNSTDQGKMIGKTTEVLFLNQKEGVKVIPITSLVKKIGLPSEKKIESSK